VTALQRRDPSGVTEGSLDGGGHPVGWNHAAADSQPTGAGSSGTGSLGTGSLGAGSFRAGAVGAGSFRAGAAGAIAADTAATSKRRPGRSPAGAAKAGLVRRGRGWIRTHPAWPVNALIVGYPLWWALGIADFIFAILAIPMVLRMYGWRARGRTIKAPPWFGIWLLFMLWVLAGAAMLRLNAPNTIPGSLGTRILSYGQRTANYAGVTVLLLYVGNLTERELPRLRLARMLGLLAMVTIAGGIAGVLWPRFQYNSPFLYLLPHRLQANGFIQDMMVPGFSQVQNLLGTAQGRPKAPFDYTNIWGDCLSILVPWLIVGWWSLGTRRQRRVTALALIAAVVPAVYSLNRGMWVGVGLSVGYVAVRLAARGRREMLGTLCASLAVGGVIFLVTPLHAVISDRLANGQSNAIRTSLSASAIKAAESSPVLGFGGTRNQRGSPHSIAVGHTATCRRCGNASIGSNGQLWLLLISDGFVGAALYLAFFAAGAMRYRRDTGMFGMAGVLVLLLSLWYSVAYVAVVAPLGFTMLAYAILWKNEVWKTAVLSDEVPANKMRHEDEEDLA
jgi:hypothetical protein